MSPFFFSKQEFGNRNQPPPANASIVEILAAQEQGLFHKRDRALPSFCSVSTKKGGQPYGRPPSIFVANCIFYCCRSDISAVELVLSMQTDVVAEITMQLFPLPPVPESV